MAHVLNGLPEAAAVLQGDKNHPRLKGVVLFYETAQGVFVVSEITGLPESDNPCGQPIFAFHIHSGGECTGTSEDPFANAGTHFNPKNCLHPYHAGDMPPLFGAKGNAASAFLTDRFGIGEIIGKTVIIHSHLDDFTTQPSGGAGMKIACGTILPVRR